MQEKNECNWPDTDKINEKNSSLFTLCTFCDIQLYMEFISQENVTLVCESQWYKLVAPGGDFADRN